MQACDLLEAELGIDRLEARLAAELPGHVRAFARAYAAGAPTPPAPPIDRTMLGALEAARAHPLLADRVLALARLLVPLAIETAQGVAAARADATTWPGYSKLQAGRDAVARAQFGRPFLELVHLLHGVPAGALPREGTIETLAGWHEPDGVVVDVSDLRGRWRALAAAHDLAIEPAFVASAARPRAFVVEPRREVILVVPARLDTPYARFAALHELGHAVVAALAPAGTPRVLDEAVASWTARALESPSDPWHSPLAAEARAPHVARDPARHRRGRSHPPDDRAASPLRHVERGGDARPARARRRCRRAGRLRRRRSPRRHDRDRRRGLARRRACAHRQLHPTLKRRRAPD